MRTPVCACFIAGGDIAVTRHAMIDEQVVVLMRTDGAINLAIEGTKVCRSGEPFLFAAIYAAMAAHIADPHDGKPPSREATLRALRDIYRYAKERIELGEFV